MTLLRPLGTIWPVALATISTLPKHAQTRAAQNSTMIVPPMAPARGDGGVSTISSAAGRNARSFWLRPGAARAPGRKMRSSANFMEASLQAIERRITAALPEKVIMGAILDQTATVNGDKAVAPPHGRQPVGN